MILRLFSSGKVDEFARDLALDLARRYPAVIANDPEPMVSQKRVAEILEETFTHARGFNRENQLGMLGRAKLGRTFKWELKEMGYERKFVETAAEELAVRLVRGPK
ncbi:MAG: hypothetical protein WA373_11120 [Burkholderiales bacterium]